MTPKRKQTNGQNTEPVRFYKYVALTFLFITIILLGIIIFMSSKRAEITVITKAELIEINEELEFQEVEGVLVNTEVNLTKNFKPTQVKEESDVAIGVVILHNETNYNQPLIATTRLLTSAGILFRLKAGVVVPAQGTVEAEVYADVSGRESEIGPAEFTIPGLREDKQKLVYATSDSPMMGGIKMIGILGEQDWATAEKELVADLEALAKEKLEADYSNLTGVYQLAKYEVTSDNAVGDELEDFELTGKAIVVAVFYEQDRIKDLVKIELNKKLISHDELLATDGMMPTVILTDYDLIKATANLNVHGSGLVLLNPESLQLQKQIFFGKTRDEVRRYLLSLDHVQGVEIKFSPAWMQTVPHVPEHVTVIVKNVE